MNREAYLKFDISSISTISTATLRLWGVFNDTVVPVVAYQAGNTTWNETTVTWNTPKPGTTWTGVATTSVTSQTAGWYTWDVTSFIQAEKTAAHSIVSIALTGVASTTPYAAFNSREAGSNTPVLRIRTIRAQSPTR